MASAAALVGLVPGWLRIVGVVGSLLFAGAGTQVVGVTEGAAVIGLAYVGFVCWLVVLVTVSVGMLRSAAD